MKTRTETTIVHRTHITGDARRSDGGRALLLEAFDLIRSESQVGELTVQFGWGGSISSITFRETEKIDQKDIEFAENGTSPE